MEERRKTVCIQITHMINHEGLGLAGGALAQRGSALVRQSSSLAQPSPKHGGCTGTFSMSLSLSLSLPLSLSYSLSLYLCPLMIIQ